jgi:hypothetical protein
MKGWKAIWKKKDLADGECKVPGVGIDEFCFLILIGEISLVNEVERINEEGS